MSLKVIINFEDTYTPKSIAPDFSEMSFMVPLKSAAKTELVVQIKPHPELPNVYNLGFGPPDKNGRFLDDVRLHHQDTNKVFSTVLLFSFTFLQEYPLYIIGLDGSDDTRATLYHMMFKTNKVYLSDYFTAIGVDWYVRIYRDNTYEQDEHGFYIKRPRPEPFDYRRTRHDLYRYYMFKIK